MILTVAKKLKSWLTEGQYQSLKRGYLTVKNFIGRFWCPWDLYRLALYYGSDKWDRDQSGHGYARHYVRYFQPIRKKRLKILEIGIGGYEWPTLGGETLRVWKAYFPKSEIYGLDYFDKKYHEENRIKIFQGSQADPVILDRIYAEMGSMDIIIDDGSHQNEHVIFTFERLFPLLKSGGIYVVEDTLTSYSPASGGDFKNLNNPQTSVGYFKRLVDGLNYKEFESEGTVDRYFSRNITSIHFYHNIIFILKGENR